MKKKTAAPVTERVIALRERRAKLGLTRIDLYAHPLDHEEIKQFADKLQRKRELAAEMEAAGLRP